MAELLTAWFDFRLKPTSPLLAVGVPLGAPYNVLLDPQVATRIGATANVDGAWPLGAFAAG